MDPLQILRDYSLRGELDRVVIDGEQIQFGEQYAFPKHAKTAYKSKRGEGDFYSLHTVLFALQNEELMLKNFSNYLPECNSKGVPSVAFVDRKDLMQHLTESGFTSKNIETVAPPLEVPLAVEKPQKGDQRQASAAEAAVAEGDAAGEGGETLALKQILHRERQLHDRNSMLVCGRRDFSSVISILHQATKQAPKAHARPSARPAAPPAQHRPPPQQQHMMQQQQQQQMNLNMPQRGGRYDQTSQQAWKGELGQDAQALQEFGISTEGGFMRKKRKAGEGEPGPKPVAPAHRMPEQPKAPVATKQRPPKVDPRARAVQSSSRPKPRGGAAGGAPIIIVPSGFGSLLNLYNARQFLEDGAYVSWKSLKEEGHKPEKMVKMSRKFGRDKPPYPEYHLMDKPPPPKHPDWERVVAVFVVGKAWQFKGWPFKGANEGDLVDTFDRVMGFHVQFLDEPRNEAVAKWKVKKYTLDRNHRHFDSAVAREIWKTIDHGLASRKSALNY